MVFSYSTQQLTNIVTSIIGALPLKNNRPCDTLDHHIRRERRIGRDRHHNKEFCDQEITLPDNIDSDHKPCFSSHQSV